MSFVAEMENIIKENGERGLEVLLFYRGLDLRLMRQTVRDDAYGRVHNKNAGGPVTKVCDFSGAIAGDDFFSTTFEQAGIFKKAWLFVAPGVDIRPGDEVEVVRTDGRRMAYRVEQNPSVGMTTKVFTKWELSGIM